MKLHEAPRGHWGHWLRVLVVWAWAVGCGTAGLLLGSQALWRPLLPFWGRVLIGGVALGALLTSLLALHTGLEVWGLPRRKQP